MLRFFFPTVQTLQLANLFHTNNGTNRDVDSGEDSTSEVMPLGARDYVAQFQAEAVHSYT